MSKKLTGLLIGLLLVVRIMAQQRDGAPNAAGLSADQAGSWAYYGQDAGGKRYTGLQQINAGNVGQLTVAWTYRTGELKKYAGTSVMEKAAFETTPILIGRTLYFSTPSDRVIALDAATGEQKWIYDPGVNLQAGYSEISSRGVAAWPAGAQAVEKIFIGTIDGRLIGPDAVTGRPAASFGND